MPLVPEVVGDGERHLGLSGAVHADLLRLFYELTVSCYIMPVASRTFEIKYRVPAESSSRVLGWLQAGMLPDPKYSAAVVHTLYFDTRSLSSFSAKENSDFLKTKVRLRCYSDLNRQAQGERVFCEVKYRIGRMREKIRFETDFSPEQLMNPDSHQAELLGVNELLSARGVPRDGLLLPALQLEYTRHRFLEPLTAARICLDTQISVLWANPSLFPSRFLRFHAPGRLPVSVFEYKHDSSELPRTLQPLYALGIRLSSFSKYYACVQLLTQEDELSYL